MDVLGLVGDLEFEELLRLYRSIENNARNYHNLAEIDTEEEDRQERIMEEYEESKAVFMQQYFPELTIEDMVSICSFCERESEGEFEDFKEENKDKKMNLLGMTLDSTLEDDFQFARNIILKNKLSDPLPNRQAYQTVFGKTLFPLLTWIPKKEYSEMTYSGLKQRIMFNNMKFVNSEILKSLKISELESILYDKLSDEYKDHSKEFLYVLLDYCVNNHKKDETFLYSTFLDIVLRRIHLLRHEEDIISPSNDLFKKTIIAVLDNFLDNN